MPIAVVTGATGCIGRNLVNELLDDEWRVIVLHRASSKVSRLDGKNVELRCCDLYSPKSVWDAMPSRADCVFHVAANLSHWRGDADRQWKDNVLATRNLVAAARGKKAKRFVFTSTGATKGNVNSGYVRTKREAETEIVGIDAVILQPAVVIGPYDWNNYSTLFTRDMRGIVFPGEMEFCHAQDVARAHIRAYERGVTGERYELHGERATWLDVFQRIARLSNAPVPQRATPKWALYGLAAAMEGFAYLTRTIPPLTVELVQLICASDITAESETHKAFNVLGYKSRSLDDALRDCWEWCRHERL